MPDTFFVKNGCPDSQLYANLGWTVSPSCRTRTVSSTLPSSNKTVSLNPNLVGGVINRPMGLYGAQCPIQGAAEFSHPLDDILRASLFMFAVWPLCTTILHKRVVRTVQGRTMPLCVFTHFSGVELLDYFEMLLRTRLEDNYDVWFDLNNGSVLTFDQHFDKRVHNRIQQTFLALL